jgi:hypothetical protein
MLASLTNTTSDLTDKYIEYDIDDLLDLRRDYCDTIEFILEELPDVNWNSRVETKEYFRDEYNVSPYSLKIADLIDLKDDLEDEEYTEGNIGQCREELQGLIELYKLKYTIKNHIDCALKHQKDGKVYLREVNGELRLPNRQPLTYSIDIQRCIKKTHI